MMDTTLSATIIPGEPTTMQGLVLGEILPRTFSGGVLGEERFGVSV